MAAILFRATVYCLFKPSEKMWPVKFEKGTKFRILSVECVQF